MNYLSGISVYLFVLLFNQSSQKSLDSNLAENKPVTSSSYIVEYKSLAPSRVTDGSMNQRANSGTGCFASGWGPLPWIQVDLEQSYNVDKIVMFLSEDNCKDGYVRETKQDQPHACHKVVSGYEIYIGESKNDWKNEHDLCYRHTGTAKSVEDVLCRQTMSGRFLTVHLPFNQSRAEIIICEIYVFDQPRVTLKPQVGRPPPIDGNLWCRYSLWMTFDGDKWDHSYMWTWVNNNGVELKASSEVTDRRVAEFSQGSHLVMPKFGGFWFSPHTDIVVMFKVNPLTQYKRDIDTVLSNGGCNDRSSLFVGFNRQSNRVVVSVKMKENFRVTMKINGEVNKWMEVKVELDSRQGVAKLTGTVNGRLVQGETQFMDQGNGIDFSMNPLYVGSFPVFTANCQPFTGQIDSISLFHC